jgi:hypothetical protein
MAAVTVGTLVCCGGSGTTSPLLRDRPNAGPDIQAGCELVMQRCTRCHTIERILVAHVSTPAHWARYVTRMRLMPASGIDTADVEPILRCLVYHSFGNEGLEQSGRLTPADDVRDAPAAPDVQDNDTGALP